MNSGNPINRTQMETPNRNWTPRWVSLKAHAEQLRLWNDATRFKIIPAGRRSGKTELAKRRLVEHLFRKTSHGGFGYYFAAAPTREQAKRIWWADLKKLIPREWRRVSESELWIRTSRAQLHVVGLDKPDRIEGTPWDGGCIDELASCKSGLWDANIRPALSTLNRSGWCWLLGVPDMDGPAQVDYEKLYQIAASGLDPEWALFHWPSADILPAAEVESAKSHMDSRLFEQEYLGKFILTGGRAFPDFDTTIHAASPVPYDNALPICWSLDFNINPMCSGVIQHHKGEVRIVKELVLPDTKTDSAITAFLAAAKAGGWNLENMSVYGDASGAARDSTSGVTDWYIVRNRLKEVLGEKFSMRVPRANPGIKDTINAVNAKIMAADGTVSLRVDPNCVTLIDNFRTALWPSPNDLADEHCLAWLRYFVDKEFPITPQRNMVARFGTAA